MIVKLVIQMVLVLLVKQGILLIRMEIVVNVIIKYVKPAKFLKIIVYKLAILDVIVTQTMIA